jgi:SAM-dependent methyltransferase
VAEDIEAGATRITETWDSFWGHLLLWRFHERNPQRWAGREKKVDWIVRTLGLSPGARVLDLACGDGLLSICLARRGYDVTGLDRIGSVLEAARAEAEGLAVPVEFVQADMRTHDFAGRPFDAVVFFDTLGLMGQEAEVDLFGRLRAALSERARIALDWPREPGRSEWEREFSDGTLRMKASYDAATRVQTIVPEFHRHDGTVVELHDPYADPDHMGIRRHIYRPEEAKAVLAEAGYEAEEVPHYSTRDYSMLLAAPRGPSVQQA